MALYNDMDDMYDRFPLDVAEIYTFSQAVCKWNTHQNVAQQTFEKFLDDHSKRIAWGEPMEYTIVQEVGDDKEVQTIAPYEDNLVVQCGWWKPHIKRLPPSIEADLNRLKKKSEKEKKKYGMVYTPPPAYPSCSSSEIVRTPPPKEKKKGCMIS